MDQHSLNNLYLPVWYSLLRGDSSHWIQIYHDTTKFIVLIFKTNNWCLSVQWHLCNGKWFESLWLSAYHLFCFSFLQIALYLISPYLTQKFFKYRIMLCFFCCIFLLIIWCKWIYKWNYPLILKNVPLYKIW